MKMTNIFLLLNSGLFKLEAKYHYEFTTGAKIICIAIGVICVVFIILEIRQKMQKGKVETKQEQPKKVNKIYVVKTDDFGYTKSFKSLGGEITNKNYEYVFLKKKDEVFHEFITKARIEFPLENVKEVNMEYVFISRDKIYEKIKDDYYLSPYFVKELFFFIQEQNDKYLEK